MPVALADVFDVEAAEAPYQRLVAALNRQEMLLERLDARLDTLERHHEATSRAVARIDSEKIASLQNEIIKLESSAERGRQELRKEYHEQVRRLEAVVSEKSDRKEVLDAIGRAERGTVQLGLEIRAEAASFDLVNNLQASQSLLHERLETMDRRLDGKVDKTEAARMSAALTQIREFRPMAAQMTARIETLEAESMLLIKNVAETKNLLEVHSKELSRVDGLASGNKVRTSEIEHELLQVLTPHVQSIQDQMAAFNGSATKWAALTDKLDEELNSLSSQFCKQATSFTDSAQQLQTSIQALKEDIMVLRDRSNDTWRKISKSLTDRAKNEAVQVLNEKVQRLSHQCEALERHAEVSARFLDWFATRGEAHEHNMRIVETQLGRITVSSDPQRREPFGGNVRFSPST